MYGKKIKFRMGHNNKVGIREQYKKRNKSNKEIYLEIFIGVDSDFNISEAGVFKKNFFNKNENPIAVERVMGKNALYYLIEKLNYMIRFFFTFNDEEMKIEKITMDIFIPKEIETEKEIFCQEITNDFSEEIQKEILNKTLDYALRRTLISLDGISQNKINEIVEGAIKMKGEQIQ